MTPEFKVLRWYEDELQSRNRDFYRCDKCGLLFTREQELEMLARLSADDTDNEDIQICKCGSRRYTPGWPVRLDWLRWPVLRYTAKLVVARGIAPWAEKAIPRLLPRLNSMAKPLGWDILMEEV